MSILTTATATLSLLRKAVHRLTSRGRKLLKLHLSKNTFIRIFIVIAVCSGSYIHVCAQDTLNQYIYLHPINNSVVNTSDSFRVKTGYWIESDTLVNESIGITSGQKPRIGILTPMIIIAKGKYYRNQRVGWWKYYDIKNVLLKEVDYTFGHISKIKTYYPNGNVKMSGELHENSFHYEK
jgi:hypothetical protein